MSAVKLLRNGKRLLSTRGMLFKWLRWQAQSAGGKPELQVDSKAAIRGFLSFSEFWSSDCLMPSPAERAFLARHLPGSGAILDVGANLGVFTAILANLRPDCVVHAIEPSPQTFPRLVRNMHLNHLANVRCCSFAMGAREGIASFLADPSSPATNRLGLPDESNPHALDVLVTTLDAYCAAYSIEDVAFLKIDVEGAEADVIRGGSDLFGRRRVAVGLVELCPGNLMRAGRSCQELLDVVAGVGYELRFILEDGNLGKPVDMDGFQSTSLANAALLPRQSAEGAV